MRYIARRDGSRIPLPAMLVFTNDFGKGKRHLLASILDGILFYTFSILRGRKSLVESGSGFLGM